MISLRVLDFGRTDTTYQVVYEPRSIYTRIELVLEGSARFMGERPIVLGKGMLGIFPPGTFRIEFSRRAYRSFFLHALYLPALARPVAVPIDDDSVAGKIAGLLVALPVGADKAVASKLAESLLIEANRTAGFHPVVDSRMSVVMKHIADSEGRTSVARLAEIALLHPKYFMSSFKREFGVTVEKCIALQRIASARKLLAEGNPIPKAALDSGFENEKSFSRFFKRHTSLTPGAFRAMHRIPVVHVPRVAKVDKLGAAPWEKGALLDTWFTIYEAKRHRASGISGRILHDGVHLFVRVEERIDTARLVTDRIIHHGDDWEWMFGPRRGHPYRYLKAAPDGRVEWFNREEGRNREWRRRLKAFVVNEEHLWSFQAAIPLSDIVTEKNGRAIFYGNLCRQIFQGAHLALSSTISFSFHTPSRFAQFILE